MQITRQSEYAIKTVLELSINYDKNISAKTISERQGVPEFFLKKTIQLLARAGIVQTRRGSRGGVKLVKSPEKLTIADVLQAIEGGFALNVCLVEGHNCTNKNACRVRSILERTQNAMLQELTKETFADLAGKAE